MSIKIFCKNLFVANEVQCYCTITKKLCFLESNQDCEVNKMNEKPVETVKREISISLGKNRKDFLIGTKGHFSFKESQIMKKLDYQSNSYGEFISNMKNAFPNDKIIDNYDNSQIYLD